MRRVEIGQTFADMDRRAHGRYLVVRSIDADTAECDSWWTHDQRDHHGRRLAQPPRPEYETRSTRIHVLRLRPPHYQLVCVRVMGIDAVGQERRCGLPEFADVHDPLGRQRGDEMPSPLFVHPFDTVPALEEDQPVRFVELPDTYNPLSIVGTTLQEAR